MRSIARDDIAQVIRRISISGPSRIGMSPIPEFDYDKLLFRERDIHPVTANTRADGRELLAEAAAVGVRPAITKYPLCDANRAL